MKIMIPGKGNKIKSSGESNVCLPSIVLCIPSFLFFCFITGKRAHVSCHEL